MHDDAYLELCAAHALGSLDPADAARLHAHLAEGCAPCRDEMALHRDTVERLGRALPANNAPEGAEARLMERIEASEAAGSGATAPARTTGARTFLPWIQRIAALLVVGVAIWMIIDRGRQINSLSSQMITLQQTTKEIQQVVAAYELRGTEHAPGAHGHAYAQRHSEGEATKDKLVLHVTDLDPCPEGKVYTAWAVSEDKIEEVGTVRPDDKGEGYSSLAMPSHQSPFQLHLTLEDVTHQPEPAGKKVLIYTPPDEQP